MINDNFRKTLPLYLFEFWLAKKLGCRVVIFPQSIGPLRRRWTRVLTSWVLNQCDIVTARDDVSLDELKALKVCPKKIYQSPDVGVRQPVSDRQEAEQF